MDLLRGICLQSFTPELLSDSCVSCNSGVERVAEDGDKLTFFPREDWHPLTDHERQTLLAQNPAAFAVAVTLFQLDAAIFDAFAAEVHPVLFAAQQMDSDTRAERITRFATAVLESIRSLHGVEAERVRSRDVYAIPAPARSTAYDFRNRKYIGLHLDNHDKLPLTDRPAAFQLLNVNCGTSHRYFQFINLPACDLFRKYQAGGALDEEVVRAEAWRLKDRCLAGDLANYPVIRVRLAPGQGYICVTQNVIHDGATNEQGELDVSFLIGGWFRSPLSS